MCLKRTHSNAANQSNDARAAEIGSRPEPATCGALAPNFHVVATAAPQLVSTEFPCRSRGVATVHQRKLPAANVRPRSGRARRYTTFFQPYGTSFDDANLGKWVQRAERVHGLAVDKVAQHGIGVDLAKTEGPLPLGDEVVRRKATG